MTPRRLISLAAVTLTLVAVAPPRSAHADGESELRARWKGKTVITKVPVFSECTDHFTDNAVPPGSLPHGDGLRFGAGEIATVDALEVTWTRIDVSIGFLEPYRVTWKDGPFTLYDQHRCRVQLKLELPRDVRKDAAKAGSAISALLAVFPNAAEARRAPDYNARRVEAYPLNYERTRAEYETWHAARVNAAVQERIDVLLREAQDTVDRGREDEGYQRCFGKGAHTRSYQSFGSCESVLNAYFVSSGSCENQRGFDDGQRLAWTVGMVRALSGCFAPVAPPPGH